MSPPNDLAAARDLEVPSLGLPAGLEIEWLGVSGYRLTFEGVSIFVDPYVSRAPLRSCCCGAGPARHRARRPYIPPGEVAGVLVGHTHFDHAVDAPAMARRYGTNAYGSDSLAR